MTVFKAILTECNAFVSTLKGQSVEPQQPARLQKRSRSDASSLQSKSSIRSRRAAEASKAHHWANGDEPLSEHTKRDTIDAAVANMLSAPFATDSSLRALTTEHVSKRLRMSSDSAEPRKSVAPSMIRRDSQRSSASRRRQEVLPSISETFSEPCPRLDVLREPSSSSSVRSLADELRDAEANRIDVLERENARLIEELERSREESRMSSAASSSVCTCGQSLTTSHNLLFGLAHTDAPPPPPPMPVPPPPPPVVTDSDPLQALALARAGLNRNKNSLDSLSSSEKRATVPVQNMGEFLSELKRVKLRKSSPIESPAGEHAAETQPSGFLSVLRRTGSLVHKTTRRATTEPRDTLLPPLRQTRSRTISSDAEPLAAATRVIRAGHDQYERRPSSVKAKPDGSLAYHVIDTSEPLIQTQKRRREHSQEFAIHRDQPKRVRREQKTLAADHSTSMLRKPDHIMPSLTSKHAKPLTPSRRRLKKRNQPLAIRQNQELQEEIAEIEIESEDAKELLEQEEYVGRGSRPSAPDDVVGFGNVRPPRQVKSTSGREWRQRRDGSWVLK
ncbi:uncharacterized protein L969DRAFT_42454 [Mixia osmundae IAM 14324]|uniref:Uncharacterized protein n=1 Tax=Mixia osmundae (strain CBS 9802 / IAM 14324 / JCM 22182 / KY 12970) TaxID=764103 RepID=G7DVA2_MIXOS|nr:uncharacterized protein L969DRAFT_42454 [Mixia osmundae IAM 14324]KEI42065.1 hypothetical protein L969DRAFT_42454 [Mixia osmundae IAM 14324]GAA94512.1 hypothetical protein E5Q_01164 [Mixia osmundae IAM 14324]